MIFTADPQAEEKAESPDDIDVLQDFKDGLAEAKDYWNPIYERCKKHMRFVLLGKQFDDGEGKKMGFDRFEEPNLLLTYLNHECNTTLQTDFLPKVMPNGGGAVNIEARAREEVLRGLHRKNGLVDVLNKTRRMQCAAGIYYAWTNTPYADGLGVGKTITVEGIEQTFNCYPDPYVKTATFRDAIRWYFKQDIPRSKWKAETGLDPDAGWLNKKTKEVWHYFVKKETTEKKYLKDDDSWVNESEMEDKGDMTGIAADESGPLYRDTTKCSWHWYKIAEDKIIDDEPLKGKESPITACIGRKVVDGEKVEYQPLTQFAEVPQRMYTILHNLIKLRLGRSPYSKWKYAFESVLNAEQMQTLRDSAVMGDTDIPYKAFDSKGNAIPGPEEIQPYILDPILISLKQDAEIQIQKIFGIFEANLGEQGNETSEVAITARAKSGDTSNYDLKFNFLETITQIGRCELDLIPKVLTPQQQLAFVDQTDKEVVDWIMSSGASQEPFGDEEYSLSIEPSPTADTARQDEADGLARMAKESELIARNPRAMAIVIAAQPGRHSQELAQIIAGDDPEKKQMGAQIQQLQGKLQQTQDQAKAKMAQDAITVKTLQSTITLMRQQMSLAKSASQAQGGPAENPAYKEMELRLHELEVQVKQYQAETDRIDVLATHAEPAPEPVTPAPGQAIA